MNGFLKHKIAALIMVFALALPVVVPVAVSAAPTGFAIAIKCEPGETAIKLDGEEEAHSCCPSKAYATTVDKTTGKRTDVAKTCFYAKYVNPLIVLLSALVGIVVVGSVIYGGIQYSMSAGDPQKAAQGKDHIRNALIGLLAYILLYAFIQFLVPGGRFNV